MPDRRETDAAGSPPTPGEAVALRYADRVEGWQGLASDIDAVIQQAVAAETDRCAKVAADVARAVEARAAALPAGVGARRHMEAVAAAEGVAAAIRAGVTP